MWVDGALLAAAVSGDRTATGALPGLLHPGVLGYRHGAGEFVGFVYGCTACSACRHRSNGTSWSCGSCSACPPTPRPRCSGSPVRAWCG